MILKKFTLALLACVMFAAFSTPSSAEEATLEIGTGVLSNNRVLIPLRVVSSNLGAEVTWYKEGKSIRIQTDEKEIWLVVNFKNAKVNEQIIRMDSPVEIIGNTAYVPLRFVSQTLGAKLEWNPQTKQATIHLNKQNMIVSMQEETIQIPDSVKITKGRINVLSEKLNEISGLSQIKQVSTYFKPYFTEDLIQFILKRQDLVSDWMVYDAPETSVYYTSSTTATLSQSFVIGNTLTGDSHYVNDRNIELVYSNGVWKVNQLMFNLREIPYLGYDR
ncbi:MULTISPECIES: stalk domain-containing protein [unclassified Paenibacillus]|uniref:stalk domain-containing protein n=1 Tax=unclassified Paenibacillus TaxID=185978 RepID=UPI0009A8D88C|nr:MULTISPECIES: stalk domain-containing protein [unclassified Paenibacillus]SLJ95279.1 Copper amine oxidase N-terminal domain-containing protein [Paenibacillus sp. RU5A]SOC67367.1 Copper amine oxidase N-terminal domain-containing protein [Paenibacillus sp. RU26A]SOC69206.1 Copper amine oxidase N-terminal domain-containing protein [Paenibacillus sp. RU5M]